MQLTTIIRNEMRTVLRDNGIKCPKQLKFRIQGEILYVSYENKRHDLIESLVKVERLVDLIIATGEVHPTNREFLSALLQTVTYTEELPKKKEFPILKKLDIESIVSAGRKNILRTTKTATIQSTSINRDGEAELSVTTLRENEAIRKGFITTEVENVRIGRSFCSLEDFSKDMIVLDFAEAPDRASGLMKLFVRHQGRNTVVARKEGDDFVNIMTNKVLKNTKGLVEYLALGDSASGTRKFQILAFNMSVGEDKIEEMFDVLTNGGYSRNKSAMVSKADLAKYIARFFAWTSPNKALGNIKTTAIYFGKWGKSDDLDGMAFVSHKLYAEWLSKELGVSVKPADVIGTAVQCRPYSAKTNGVVSDNQKMIRLLSENTNGVIYIDSVTPEIEYDLNQSFKGKGKYSGYIVVLGKQGNDIEFISDLNGYKTEFNWGAESVFPVLDIVKTAKTNYIQGVNTSVQMLTSPLYDNPEGAIELIKVLRKEHVEMVIRNSFSDKKKVPSIKSVSRKVFAQQVLKQISPEYALIKDKKTLLKEIESVADSILAADNRFNYKIDGTFARILADVAAVSNLALLQFGEIFMPGDANEYFESSDNSERFMNESQAVRKCYTTRTVSLFKYPKMGLLERYKAKVVRLETILSRINRLVINGQITEQKADDLATFYKTLKRGSVVVPAIEELKEFIAGLDFDWDGATVVLDPRMNALLSDQISIVKIKTNKIKQEKNIKLGLDTLNQSFITAAEGADNFSIGLITLINDMQALALVEAKSKMTVSAFDQMRTMLEKYFNSKGGSLGHVGLPKQKISLSNMDNLFELSADDSLIVDMSSDAEVTIVEEDNIDNVIEAIKQADWSSNRNLISIFKDLNAIFRFYQESKIDSTKTGVPVDVKIAPGTNYDALYFQPTTIKFDYKFGGLVTATVSLPAKIKDKKTELNNVLTELKKDFAQSLEEEINDLLQNKTAGLSMEETLKLTSAFNNPRYLGSETIKANQTIGYGFSSLVKRYGDLTAFYTTELSKTDPSDNDYEEKVAVIKDNYRAGIQAIQFEGRKMTSHFTPSQRGAFAKFMSLYSLENKNKRIAIKQRLDGGTSFALNVFSEEYIAYVSRNFDAIDFCGEELKYNAFYQDGDIITLKDGVNEYAMTIEKITGDFVVREFDNKLYATKQLSDMITADTDESYLVRISDASIEDMAAIANNLNKNAKNVTLIAESKGGKHTYEIQDENGVQLAKLDAQGINAQAINGFNGSIKALYCGITNVSETIKKPYILALVK